jgi:thiamine-phosphate pyrophosphorylase
VWITSCENLIFQEEMNLFFIDWQEYWSRLVLHQQHQLALDFGVNRIHFTENAKQVWIWNQQIIEMVLLNRLQHSIIDFNKLDVLNTLFESDLSKYF